MTITSGDVIAVLLIVVPAISAWILKIKSIAYKAELVELIDGELEEKIKPIKSKIDSQESTVTFQAESIRDLVKHHDINNIRMTQVLEAIEKIPDTMEKHIYKLEKMMEKEEANNKDKFRLVWERLEHKMDKHQ
jgi:hypothetical protein